MRKASASATMAGLISLAAATAVAGGTGCEDGLHNLAATVSLGGKVDRKAGVIKGVSVITSGVTAKGHNLEVDKTTLTQMKAAAETKGKVPVKWNHGSGADAVAGYLTNFRISGRKLLADWHLLKSHDKYEQALELVETMGESVGLSASFMGDNEHKGDKEYARCRELISVDLVATPAANPDGMFSTPPAVDTGASGMAKTTTAPGGSPDPKDEPVSLAAVLAAIQAGNEENKRQFEAIEQRFQALESDDTDDDEDDDENGGDPELPAETEFRSFDDVVRYFEAAKAKAETEAEKQELQAGITAFEQKFNALLGVNEQLLAENEAMALVIQEYEAKSNGKVELSAGTDGEPVVSFQREETGAGGAPLTDYEKRVKELEAKGKSKGEALLEAQKEDRERYTKHLEAKGAFAQRL